MSQTTNTTGLTVPATYASLRKESEQHYQNSLQTTDMRSDAGSSHMLVMLVNTAIETRTPEALEKALKQLEHHLAMANRYRNGEVDPNVSRAQSLLEQYQLLGKPVNYVPNTLSKKPGARFVEGGRIA